MFSENVGVKLFFCWSELPSHAHTRQYKLSIDRSLDFVIQLHCFSSVHFVPIMLDLSGVQGSDAPPNVGSRGEERNRWVNLKHRQSAASLEVSPSSQPNPAYHPVEPLCAALAACSASPGHDRIQMRRGEYVTNRQTKSP